jgi:hypothetical protein
MSPPPPNALVNELTGGKGVGPAGLSAANALRLSTQVPRRAEYAVPRRAPADAGAIRFVSRAARSGRARSRLNPTEVAALEVLDAWEDVIEVSPDEAIERLGRLVRDGAIRPEKMARAATTESKPVKDRLKVLLERTDNRGLALQVAASPAHAKAASRVKASQRASLAAR